MAGKLAAFISSLRKDSKQGGQLIWEENIPSRPAIFGRLKRPLSSQLTDQLKEQGAEKLYRHQAEAINLARAGKNVIVVTGPASGKTLSYHIPILEAVLRDSKTCALFLFPTKALAQDQLRAISRFGLREVEAATYDGDSLAEERRWVRAQANLVLSNPDMLHCGILPYHTSWARFLLNLRFVVLDEVHVFRGVFGSNVAEVIRRLRRICAHYKSCPQFILSSATVANPAELAEKLTGLKVEVVDRDSSPAGPKSFIFWNPPFADETRKARRSSNYETTYLLQQLAGFGIRTIAFSKSRRAAELVYKYAQEGLKDKKIARKLASYRAGYLPKQRRQIERQLFSGKLLGVSSTSALELGIDVGELDACVINGFPGTISSTWQQAGRSGRRQGRSLAILVGREDPLDQYYLTHPQAFFGRPHEEAIVDTSNSHILTQHLKCAAYELPLTEEDQFYFGSDFSQVVEKLVGEGELRWRRGRWYVSAGLVPAPEVGIRYASRESYSVVEADSGVLIGTVDGPRAFLEIHPGAIYLHQGDSYLVTDLDLNEKVATIKPTRVDYYTQAREETSVEVMEEKKRKKLGSSTAAFGDVEVTTHVMAFQRKHIYTGKTLSTEELDLPPLKFQTEAWWFVVPQRIVEELGLSKLQLAGGIHGAEHAAIALLPLYALCDRGDIGGVSTPFHYHTGEATIFIYDGFEGGIGLSARGYSLCHRYLQSTLRAIKDCPCQEGCPSCIQSPKCGNWNEPLDKQAAIRILGRTLASMEGKRRKGKK